ncbi:MAG: HAMP domain-containing histidine kinase [Cyanobacteria bacterium K_Offshore_surface_m2_239]|nr:HAMP domain-containing histidine kinase [Cyanobacteria bacterium K_Offshore_surface_m2_239]
MLTSWLVPAVIFTLGMWLGLQLRRGHKHGVGSREPSREQLLSWLYQAPQGWLIVDASNRVFFFNGRAQRLLLMSSTPNPGLDVADLPGFNSLIDLLNDVRLQGQPTRLEWVHRGQELEVFAFPDPANWVAILLQSRRSLEAQLNQQERWVSDVAHELKTPLTALMLVGDSLAATVSDHNAVLVERLLKELRRMQDLVADLLELSRLENVLPGKGIPQESILLHTLINDVWLGIKPMADMKEISIKITSDEINQDMLVVHGDQRRLHRALLNLFDNAVRYSPHAGEISVALHASNDWIRIEVQDQGPGLSEQDLQHMFERFYRGDASRFRHHRGASGLGLAIVQQIILTHGGWILGENAPSGGARFELRLPRRYEISDHS